MSSNRWLADPPSKAAFERLALSYTPAWMAAVAIVIVTGWFRAWGDVGYLSFGVALCLPTVMLPIVRPAPADRGVPWHRRHFVRFNLWLAIFVFVANYVDTHYFFDLMGMRYGFPTDWTLEARGVGRSGGEVPIFLYFMTHAYFTSYYVAMGVVLRAVRRRWRPGYLVTGLVVAFVAYAVAWLETFTMATDALAGVFSYADRITMLGLGSLFYGSLFVVSLPLLHRLDEETSFNGTPVSIVIEALGASMAGILALEAWSRAWPL